MNEKELNFILQQGEGQYIEFKESFDKSLAKEIVAFANAMGGRIFLGVGDDNKVKEVKATNKLKSQIQDMANNCDPKIDVMLEEFNNIVIINVYEGNNKLYSCKEGFYFRQGANSQKMRRDEIVQMILSKGNKRFDEIITKVEDYDKETVAAYLNKAGINQPITKSTLFNLGVANKKGYLNNAGILFFTKHPKSRITSAYVTCARYKGTEKVNVIDRKDFEGDLISQVENSVDFVKRNTRLAYEISGLYRKDIPEYPIEAVREAILNAVMHRDYFEKGANVQIDILDDRLVVTNLGSLIKPLTKETLGKIAVRRNPLIADLFHRIHLVEKMGTGINRIREECKKHGNIKFQIEADGFFIASFKLKKVREIIPKISDGLVEKVTEKVTENQKKILNNIFRDRFVTVKKLSKIVGISERKIKENISKLKQKKLLKRVGPDKGGYWKVIGK